MNLIEVHAKDALARFQVPVPPHTGPMAALKDFTRMIKSAGSAPWAIKAQQEFIETLTRLRLPPTS